MPHRLLITAGPTHEPIDAVRYLANRSSGRMGLALADAALTLGIETTLLLGPTALPPPKGTSLAVVRFQTTADLAAHLDRLWPEHDTLIMAAAVADYRPLAAPGSSRSGPSGRPGGKLRRTGERLALELEPTPDLLASLAARSRPDQVLIGFALEPRERLETSARDKLARKNLHAIVANPLETMDAERVSATVYLRSGAVLPAPPDLLKPAFAAWLLDRLPEIREG